MDVRKIIGIGAAILIVIAGYFLSTYLISQKEDPGPKPESHEARLVRTTQVNNKDITARIRLSGKLVPKRKVDITAEVTGTLLSSGKEFKIGSRFSKGDILLRVDDEEARLGLLAQKSALLTQLTGLLADLKLDYSESYPDWKAYINQFDVKNPIQAYPNSSNEQLKYFLSNRNIFNPWYTIKSQEARLAKYTVYAPFTGSLTATMIDPGGLVRTGQKLGEFAATYGYELESSVVLSDLENINIGDLVKMSSPDISGEWEGRIARISDAVDPTTQTVKVYISITGKNLREGMYLYGEIFLNTIEDVFEIDRNMIMEDDKVFIVQNDKLLLHPIEVVRKMESTVLVKGLNNGQHVLNETTTGKKEGMLVEPFN